jgi:hypothetical protein
MKMQPTSVAEQVRLTMLVLFLSGGAVWSQSIAPTNSLPNPYRGTPFGKLPDGRQWGSTAGIGTDPDGRSIWVAERCGALTLSRSSAFACDGSNLAPILKFDEQGNLVKSFWRWPVCAAARPLCRLGRQCVGDRQRRQRRQGPSGV